MAMLNWFKPASNFILLIVQGDTSLVASFSFMSWCSKLCVVGALCMFSYSIFV